MIFIPVFAIVKQAITVVTKIAFDIGVDTMSAAIYTRQSIEKKDSESIEVQIEYAKRYLEPDEDYEVFSDPGYSGKNIIRPDFQRMLQGIENGKFNKVIVYKLDRISRKVSDFSWLMEFMQKHDCTFISAKENFALDTPAGRAMLYMTSTFAQMERESTSERVKDNYYERLKLGAIGGGPAPFGYVNSSVILGGKKHSVYVPNSNIQIVKDMFEAYSSPLTTLADVKQQIFDKYGLNIQTSDISRRLHNPTYVKADASVYNYYYKLGANVSSPIESFDGIHGCLIAGRRKANERKYTSVKDHIVTVGKHEGVIESAMFLYCQNKLSKNKQIKNTHRGQYTWLSGLVKCGDCGYAMVVKRYKRKNGYVANFYCSNQSNHKTCVPHTHLVEDIEAFVYDAMVEKADSIQKAKKDGKKDINKRITELHKQLEDINAKIENLVLNLEQTGTASFKYINSRIEELDAQKLKLEEKMGTYNYETDKLIIPNLSNWNEKSLEEKKSAARLLIEKVLVSADNIITMYWKI